MSFKVDKQTLNDLAIFGNGRNKSVYDIFNKTYTRGGAALLEDMFLYPLSEQDEINQRIDVIKYYKNNGVKFPFSANIFDAIEFYLSNTDKRTQLLNRDNNLSHHVKNVLGSNTEYSQLQQGIVGCIRLLNTLDIFLTQTGGDVKNETINEINTNLRTLLNHNAWSWYKKESDKKKLSYESAVEYDRILRFEEREMFRKILHYIYMIDVYTAVAAVATERGFVFPVAVEVEKNHFDIKGAFHPFLEYPIANDLWVDANSNIIFLTGANMAGKSTFMKSLGISIFLAHVGFPIPAEEMSFSPRSGMYTTINLPDNLNMGYSHFYAEVLRLKTVAQEVNKTPRLIIIFDELFRGTNVKDAYDATIAVTQAFAEIKDCIFLISTHIMEAGEVLKTSCNNINYIYLPTIMEGSVPKYTYKIVPGITDDRHGMVIINSERILEIINKEN